MRRIGLLVAVALMACDPLLPLRVMDEVQPVDSVNLTIVSYSESSGSLRSGAYALIALQAYDKGDNPVDLAGKDLTWSLSDTEVGDIVDEEPGAIRLYGRKSGPTILTAEVEGKSATLAIVVSPGAVSQLSAVSGEGQRGVVGYQLLSPIVIQARDAYGNSVGTGTTVQFSAPNGSLTSFSQATDGLGRVEVNWTPASIGNHNVTARVGTTIQTTIPVAVTTLAVGFSGSVPASAINGQPIAPAPAIQLRYASDRAAYPRQGITVLASVTAGGATLSTTGASATSNASGVATFPGLVLTGTSGPVSLRFRVGTSADTIVTTTLVGGTATRLGLAQPLPASAVSGRAMSQAPVVQLLDANGNASAQSGVLVGVSVTAGFTLSSTSATTDANGQATFTNLAVTGTAGATFQLTFTSAGLTGYTAPSALLTGPETKLGIARSASTCLCDSVPLTTPQVRLLDAGNRNVAQAGITITASLPIGVTAATIVDGATAVTDENGIATFDSMKLKGTAGSYTLTFAANTLTSVAMSISVAAGAASALTLSTQPPATVQNGVAMSPWPQVRLVDACDNNVFTSGVAVRASVTQGVITWTGDSINTSSGVATFSNLRMAGLARKYLLRFSATGLTPVLSADSVNLTKGSANKLVLSVQPSTSASSGTALPVQPVVQVQDVGGNPVAGARTITASISNTPPPNGTVVGNGSVTLTAIDSIGIFTGLRLTGVAGSYRLLFTSSGVATDTADFATVLGGAGTASRMVLDTAPATGALSGTTLARTPVVRLQDATGADVPLAGVVIAATTETFFESGSQVVTDAEGRASFGTLTLTGTAQQSDTIEFSASGLTTIFAPAVTTLAQPLSNGSSLAATGAANSERYYGIVVPAGRTALEVRLSGGSGDANLYVHRTDTPDRATSTFTCSSTTTGSSAELCSIPNPLAGQYFILVHGATSYSSVVVRATYIP